MRNAGRFGARKYAGTGAANKQVRGFLSLSLSNWFRQFGDTELVSTPKLILFLANLGYQLDISRSNRLRRSYGPGRVSGRVLPSDQHLVEPSREDAFAVLGKDQPGHWGGGGL